MKERIITSSTTQKSASPYPILASDFKNTFFKPEVKTSSQSKVILENGDIIIEINEEQAFEISEAETEIAYLSKSSIEAQHAMIFENGNFYHSNPGEKRSGVRSHTVEKYFKDKDFDMGQYLVFRLPTTLQASLCRSVKSTEPMHLVKAEEIKTGVSVTFLPTPYATEKSEELIFGMRKPPRKQDTDKSELLELCRSFRNYVRIFQGKPFSKNKGLSCSQYVGFAIKTAIIDYLFPSGLPKAIANALDSIIAHNVEMKQSGLHKTSEVLLESFKNVVFKSIHDQSNNPPLTYINFLSTPTKGKTIQDLFTTMKVHSTLFQFIGFIYFEEDKPENSHLRVMSYSLAYNHIKAGDQFGLIPRVSPS